MANDAQLQQEVDVKQFATQTSKDDTEKEAVVSRVDSTSATTKTSGKRDRNSGKEHNPNKRDCKRAAVYGNYAKYYGYRVLKDSEEDPRLKYFKREWFEGKDCLDVGCNIGNVTISIAKKFLCRSMVGIDIDKELIYRAKNLLEKTAKSLANVHRNEKSDLQVRMLNREEMQVASSTTCIEDPLVTLENGLSGEDLLRRVSFRAKNFLEQMAVEPTYDTVLCLSVTKWVHLNWGDDGLIRLFVKIRNMLRPGGILILEPQPWKSYQSNHTVSEVVRQNYHEIVLRPDQFREVLLDRVGFRSMRSITEEIESCAEGFSRPIYLLRC